MGRKSAKTAKADKLAIAAMTKVFADVREQVRPKRQTLAQTLRALVFRARHPLAVLAVGAGVQVLGRLVAALDVSPWYAVAAAAAAVGATLSASGGVTRASDRQWIIVPSVLAAGWLVAVAVFDGA